MWKANIFLTAMCFCASLLLLSWPTPPCVLSFSLSTLFLSHLSYLFLSSFHNFCHLFPSQSPSFQIFPFFLLHPPLLLPSFLLLFLFPFFPIITFLTHLFPPLLFSFFLSISLTPLLHSLFSYPTNVTHFPSKMGISDRMVDSSQTTLVQ